MTRLKQMLMQKANFQELASALLVIALILLALSFLKK